LCWYHHWFPSQWRTMADFLMFVKTLSTPLCEDMQMFVKTLTGKTITPAIDKVNTKLQRIDYYCTSAMCDFCQNPILGTGNGCNGWDFFIHIGVVTDDDYPDMGIGSTCSSLALCDTLCCMPFIWISIAHSTRGNLPHPWTSIRSSSIPLTTVFAT